ncbi:MAG: NifU family protein [Bacteroidia bacterium]
MTTEEYDNLWQRVETALDSVRPYLRGDGGDVRIHAIHEDCSVELELMGSCETCHMSHMTMKAGLEEAIKKAAPEVKRVSAVGA